MTTGWVPNAAPLTALEALTVLTILVAGASGVPATVLVAIPFPTAFIARICTLYEVPFTRRLLDPVLRLVIRRGDPVVPVCLVPQLVPPSVEY